MTPYDEPLDDHEVPRIDEPEPDMPAAPLDGDNRRTIHVAAGRLVEMVRAGIAALRDAEIPLYDRGGALVRPVRIDTPADGDVRRSVGALILAPVDTDWLRLRLAEVAAWRRRSRDGTDDAGAVRWTERRVDPPADVARTIARVADEGGWPHLRAIARHPILTLAGEWIGAPGYHAGLLVDIVGEWVEPGHTRQAAEAALATLRDHLRHYPWASPADEAVALSLLVTAVMRCVLDAAPMHATDAPAAGTGKSLLIDAASILATGTRATVMDYGRDADEAAKRLDGLLLAGDSVIALDNVETALEGASLCQTLTQPTRRLRPLGASTMVTVPCTALVTATGNNLTIRGDLVRRAVVCRLDAGLERPELRQIDQDLIGETIERRAELVAAGQTIVRAYIAAGLPDVVPPLGSFRDWTRYVRAPLVWLGLPDPVAVIERARADDPSREAIAAVLTAWRAAYGDEAVTAQDAIGRAEHDADLRDALGLVALRRGSLDARALGYWLRAHRDTRCGALTLRCATARAPRRWCVDGVDSVDVSAPRGRDRGCFTTDGANHRHHRHHRHHPDPCPACNGAGDCKWCST